MLLDVGVDSHGLGLPGLAVRAVQEVDPVLHGVLERRTVRSLNSQAPLGQ
ncbi:hypothetical protein [Streptomyces sp. BP-8]|uniref:Uncharacterized protein n=1 Tax=Streptomyces sirii TaxID=3127701 RepID=A0ABZ2QKP2_9ACTN